MQYQTPLSSGPGDLGYTYDQCWGLFNFLNYELAYSAGITTDDYYAAPPLASLTLSSTKIKIAMTAAIIYAGVNAILAAPAISDDIGRITDSFSSKPENILPGKRNKVWNALTLTVSGVESLVRSTFIAVAAWYYLQQTSIGEGWLWAIVASCWISVAANFFKGYDDAYSRMLTATAKGVKLGKSVVLKTAKHVNTYSVVNRVTKPLYESFAEFSSYMLNTRYAQKMRHLTKG